jgi:hypothetical protein
MGSGHARSQDSGKTRQAGPRRWGRGEEAEEDGARGAASGGEAECRIEKGGYGAKE